MEILQLDAPDTRSMFETMLRQRTLVPMLGAGFSRGASTPHSHVPDANEFSSAMLDCLKKNAGSDAGSLAGKSFSEIAEYFLNPDFVPAAEAKALIHKYFIGVRLDTSRRNFLAAPWPYIYTLNIDDAIESNSVFSTKVVPNRPISEDARRLPYHLLYKVHGDAADELLYDEPSKIIFSTGQYVRSLMTNGSMLNTLKTDLIEQNTLFVGCSLSGEIDLLFALAEYQGKFPEGRRSIYVTTKAPNRFESAKLASHGINTVLLVNDYEAFYALVAQWGKQTPPTRGMFSGSTLVTQETLFHLNADRSLNLSFLLREPATQPPTSKAVLPAYHIRRDLQDVIIRTAEEFPLTLVRGRRFSGKTLLLRGIAAAVRSKEVHLVNSDTSVSEEDLLDLLEAENRLLLFDANSLTAATAQELAKASKRLASARTSAIIAVNRTEPDIVGALVRQVDDAADFEIEPRLSAEESNALNQRLDSLGLLRFDRRRTLLENTFRAIGQYPERISDLSRIRKLENKEVELILILAVADKAYSNLATALEIRVDELFALCDKLGPIVDLMDTRRGEMPETHSRHKLVTNSKTGLAIQIRGMIKANGYSWIAERLGNMIKRLVGLPEFASTAHSMYMFDAINDLLSPAVGEGESTGYRPVVRALYEDLQTSLSHSPDYWLQRAKAILRIEDDTAKLLEGIEFAMKCYREAERERSIDNAEFLIAQLYGKLCFVTHYKNVDYMLSAVRWYARAIKNYNRNATYVRSMLDSRGHRKGTFDLLCDRLEGPGLDLQILSHKRDVDFLVSSRRIWKRSESAV